MRVARSTPRNRPATPKVTVPAIFARKGGDKVVALTAYDVVFARLADQAGGDIVVVGDSLGMVVQGQGSTLPVTVEDIVYHTRAVARGVARAHLCADMPFMSYQASVEDGMRAAGRLIKDGGAESVKVEGGVEVAALIKRLVGAGIPVMGHVGLTPQSVHKFGGFKIQGRTDEQRAAILDDARAVADAAASASPSCRPWAPCTRGTCRCCAPVARWPINWCCRSSSTRPSSAPAKT